jgi:hypothetical protein
MKIPIGPFQILGWKFHVMNPSIDFNNNEIDCIARMDNNLIYAKDFEDITCKQSERLLSLMGQLEKFKNAKCHMLSLMILFKLGKESDFVILDNFEIQQNNQNGSEDPRFFRFQHQQWIYSHGRIKSNGICSPIIFPRENIYNVIELQYCDAKRMEKNWMPFEYQNTLFFEYSLEPHIILHCDMKSGKCTKVYQTNSRFFPDWELGGGAPPQRYKNLYLGIAHVRRNHPVVLRKSFFYAFEAIPPFKIMKMSPIVEFEKDVNIEFVSGFLIRKEKLIISYGRNDCSCELIEIGLDKFLKVLF